MTAPMKPERVALLVAVFVLAALNWPFWRALITAVAPSGAYEWLFIGAVFISAAAAFNLILTLLGPPRLFKAIVIPLLAVTAAASYYMSEYGIVIDKHMVANIFETNTTEATDLVTPKMILYVLGLGLVPAWLLWRTPIAMRPLRVDFAHKAAAALASVVVFAAAAAPFYMNFTSVFREHGELKHILTPLNYISATAKYFERRRGTSKVAVKPYGEDAVRGPGWASRTRKSVTVLVIGETARAANFSLDGYGRDTNPRLSKIPGLLNFSNVRSCGTDTAQSVPCLFSGAGRANYSSDIALTQEGLLDILKRSGFSLLWRENQSGCKGVCERVPLEILTESKLPAFFNNGESNDAVLLHGLEAKIEAAAAGSVFVLHMMGSHGPAYYKRYPPEFEAFTPVCKSSQFSRCTNAEIVNAYDNTILYADHVLADLIALLEKADAAGTPAAMIYVSDHGESLGENNLYLHGMPYALAPDVQKHVPMVMWFSAGYQTDAAIDTACLKQKHDAALSHDNVFHSMLGLLGVSTKVYDESLDIFASCRAEAPAHAQTGGQPKL